jgi:putative alpha-1,2-mannosidase
VRAEMAAYNARPDGLPGNDDTGEMSGWYVLAALGLYHAAPGVAAWELNSPAFPAMTVRVGGHNLVIRAPQASVDAPYVHAAALDGAPLSRTYLSTCELRSARRLDFTLGAGPDTTWGADPGAAPPSAGNPAPAPVSACTSALGSALGG